VPAVPDASVIGEDGKAGAVVCHFGGGVGLGCGREDGLRVRGWVLLSEAAVIVNVFGE